MRPAIRPGASHWRTVRRSVRRLHLWLGCIFRVLNGDEAMLAAVLPATGLRVSATGRVSACNFGRAAHNPSRRSRPVTTIGAQACEVSPNERTAGEANSHLPLPWRSFWPRSATLRGSTFHGGIASHHFLNRADMPAVSNGWGLLLCPAISWFLGGIALRRSIATAAAATINAPGGQTEAAGLARRRVRRIFAELLFGASLAATFSLGYRDVTSILFFGVLLLALVFRVYRAECVCVGFVLGMTFTFGAILPALVASVDCGHFGGRAPGALSAGKAGLDGTSGWA